MTPVDVRIEYAADVAAVFAMLTDPDFLRAKYAARGERDIEIVECARAGREFRIVSRRTVDVAVPGFAKRVLHPTNTVTQTDVWALDGADGATHAGTMTGHWKVETAGVPATMAGTMRLGPATDGESTTVETIVGEVSSRIPLLAGRIEHFVRDTISGTLASEEAFAADWLARASA